jgi:cellulose synthase/poly-beta-1,6-N-acetylglucosamine synthase-like glycosyltransferase
MVIQMLDILAILFASSLALIIYTYVGYPLLLALALKFTGRGRLQRSQYLETSTADHPFVSLIVATRGEGARVVQQVGELLAQLEVAECPGELVLVVDGPDTHQYAQQFQAEPRVKVLVQGEQRGKAAALGAAQQHARGELLVFADVRQRWEPQALRNLLVRFRDDKVGAVSGQLVLEANGASNEGVGLYWKYETWLRRNESLWWAIPGVTGAIAAVRSRLFVAPPVGTVLDDVYWPMQVVLQGYRVVHAPDAIALDRLPERMRDEFQRKVRTQAGCFQLLQHLPALLVPWRNPLWWQFVSHKVLRLLVPWCMLTSLITSVLLPGWFYQMYFVGNVIVLLAIASSQPWNGPPRSRGIRFACSFFMLNAAAALGLVYWISGRTASVWKPVTYQNAASHPHSYPHCHPQTGSPPQAGREDTGAGGSARIVPHDGSNLEQQWDVT